MKIAIPLDEDQKSVCPSFGRAPYFLLWQEGQVEILANPGAQAQGGAGIAAAQFITDHQVQVLITPRCGQNAADVFHAAGMKIYKSQGTDADENLALFQADRLEELTHFHAGYHGLR